MTFPLALRAVLRYAVPLLLLSVLALGPLVVVELRMTPPADLNVDARTTSGRFDSAFELAGSHNGHKRMTGRIGADSGTGHGTMKVATVSGDFALLRRADDTLPPEAEAV